MSCLRGRLRGGDPLSTFRSTAQLSPTDASGNCPYPLSQAADAQGNQMTGWYTIRRVGPLSLKAGDEVDLRAYEQIDNESSARAGDPWMVRVLKSVNFTKGTSAHQDIDLDPRRTLWVMIELGVWRNGTLVIRNQGENADNQIHHWTWARSDTDIVTAEKTNVFYETRVRFGWSAAYWYPGAKMEVLNRGMLSARVI